MSRIFIGCAVLLVAMTGYAVDPGGDSPKPLSAFEQTAITNEKNLISARKKDDQDFFERMVSPDFSMVGIDGQLGGGREGLGDSDLVEFTAYNMKVVPLGDAGAVVTYDAIVREAPAEDQGSPPRYQHLSSVWMKVGGAWKLEFQQTTAAHYGDW